MSVIVPIKEKYAQALAPFGDLERAVDTALQRYTIEQITAKISELRQRDSRFETKYGVDFETFQQITAEDDAFVEWIEQNVSKTWELDLAEWEFSHKGAEDWTRQLQDILLS